MADEPHDRSVGRLMTIASVGTEMAAPIVVGILADYWLGWMPALTVLGAVLGLVGGVVHLIRLNKPNRP